MKSSRNESQMAVLVGIIYTKQITLTVVRIKVKLDLVLLSSNQFCITLDKICFMSIAKFIKLKSGFLKNSLEKKIGRHQKFIKICKVLQDQSFMTVSISR